MTISYEKFNLKEVINASGRMTILGVSKVSESVLAAQRFGGEHFFEMSDLSIQTGRYLANLLKVEDAQVVSSASAGIAQSVAGLIGEGSLFHAYHPYTEKIAKREIILPKGHNVDYGTPVEVMVAQGGGQVVEAGYANMCSPEHVEMMITEQTAAILYIKSHHSVQKSMLSVKEIAEVAEKHQLPLIVDAAAEEDLFPYIEAGADLVIYSGAKAIEGPSAGLVIGKKRYIEWIRLQGKGIGRAMKIGKDNILGFTQAVEDYLKNGSESGTSMKGRLGPFIESLNEIQNLEAKVVQDGAGRDIFRASLKISGSKTATEIIQELKEKSPAIYTREYQANNGIIEFDIRSVNQEEMGKIVKRLQEIMNEHA
ncbi:DgaE family pyridoxal phosphate-dependent ammonia lyase [Enterococcus rivorum]|uniref:L-seryl-tRNA selenium transferase n=1 Tax=Enterococcus rivorum TaxID=762845 RepID=A0A1E5L1E9_9ENTE|nr:DgaE family pyridoxal phosphate-dependent ammonia lyase [Enterococcus rivorum]MBP2098733.1 L-seryl-tRNA(Ser) seleniumtransferase [Enterococcus rivorum]OEH83925.1 L-seryl-tRNA selenium transferase [Enterococcus rivorum]